MRPAGHHPPRVMALGVYGHDGNWGTAGCALPTADCRLGTADCRLSTGNCRPETGDWFMKIAYQGEPGAFSEAAGRRLVPGAELLPCRSFEDVFAAVRDGHAMHGIVPIENSIGGSIHRNYDLL